MLQNKANFLKEFWDVACRVNLIVTFVFEANQHSFISKIPPKYFKNNRIRIEFFPGNDDDILFSNDFMQFAVELNSITYSVKAGFNTIQQIYDSETMEKLYFNEECLEKLKERAKTSDSQDTASVITSINLINRIKLKEEYINKCVGSSQDQIWRHIKIVRKAAKTDVSVESGDQSDCLGAWLQRVMNDPRCITDYGNGKIMWQSLCPHVLKLDLYSTNYKACVFLILFGVELNNKTIYEIKIKALEK